MKNISRDFMPRQRRPEEEGFAPQAPGPVMPPPLGGGQQPQVSIPTQSPVTPVMPPGGQVSTGQPQPFTPVTPSLPTGTQTQPIAPPPTAPIIPETGEFPYPQAWETATDIYSRLAEGMPAMTPEYAQQAWLPYKRQAEEGAMQARESAGMTGMRWGTPLAGQMESIWGGAGERFGSEMEKMRMGDIQNQRMAMLGAAGGLGGLGGQYAQLPLTVSESMMRQGMTQQQMQQMEYDRQMQEFMRTQPEYSPYLPYMQQGAQVPTGPAQYQPSFGGQMLDIGGQMQMAKMMGLY